MKVFNIIAIGLILASWQGQAAIGESDGSGLKASIAVDMAGEFKTTKHSSASDRFDIRESELTLYAPIDHLFDGVLSMAAHREEGESLFELHEASITTTKLVPRSKIRIGQFFLGLGRLNQFHRHDWPFISTPKVHETFFGEEGALDTGIEYALLLPLPFFVEATIGLTNGWTYGHVPEEGEKPRKPTHYGRLMTYSEIGFDGGMQVGLNYLSRTLANGDTMSLMGIDLTAKWRKANYLNWMIQSEIWQRTLEPKSGGSQRSAGAYLFPLYGFNRAYLVGLRLEYFTDFSLKSDDGDSLSNGYTALIPTFTWIPSEFSKFAIAYNARQSKTEGQADLNDPSFEFQAMFIIGAHPAHDF